MRSQHQGIYCEPSERRKHSSCEELGWEQCKHIHIGENLWQRGRNSSKRGNSGNGVLQKWDGIDFINRRVSFREKMEKSQFHRLRRANAKFAGKDDRTLRDCQCCIRCL